MCGICGIALIDPRAPVDLSRLRAMRDTIAHRGPDGEGLEYWPGVGFGHRRLAIIDVAGGQQPLANEDGSVWVTFNGEIYNYLPLRDRLSREGHRFRTRSDTEVLVHAYEEYGPDFVRQLNGIFAFAIYDSRRGRVVIARDPLGIKPLFYSVTDDGLYFGSEIKAVLAGTGREPALRQECLGEYLTFRYIAGSRTFFEDVHRLPAGHVAVWENGRLSLSQYWGLPNVSATVPKSAAEATEELATLLDASVASQMMSEVPLGTFCSGGVDSGLITGYAAAHSPYRLHTFSVGFADRRWDETPMASDTARRFGTDHNVLIAEPNEFQRQLTSLIWYFDEPLNHPNSIPIYLLSRFARERVTVVLTGEGSDELFGGYPRYHLARWRERVDGGVARTLATLASHLPGHRAALAGELLAESIDDSLLLNSRYVDPRFVSRLVRYDVLETLGERRALLEQARHAGDGVSSITRYDILTYLGALLDRVDRMCMATGLEARVPFLDQPLVEWALRLPSTLKVRGRSNKRIVKRLARRTLNPRIVDGAKSGFGVPLGAWFRDATFGGLLERLLDEGHPASPLFERRVIERVVNEHRNGSVDHGQLLWLLCNVYMWHEVHLTGAGAATPAAPPGRAAFA